MDMSIAFRKIEEISYYSESRSGRE